MDHHKHKLHLQMGHTSHYYNASVACIYLVFLSNIRIRLQQIVKRCFYTSFRVVMVESMKIVDFLDMAP
jgi:hypothetical protein